MEAVEKGFMFVGSTEVAAEGEDGVVIFQRKVAEKILQLIKAVADLWWVTFVGFCVGLVELIQNSFAIGVTQIDRV